jgi:uncharacterized protein
MTHLALAAISARPLAEAAAREGFKATALDLFGDRDTLSAAGEWLPIGAPEALRIDAKKLLDTLSSLARRGDVHGWVAGAGFDGQSELLAQGAARLPLIGTAPADQRRVRDPATFFGFLKACGFSYPPVRHHGATQAAGWLAKDAGGCGGWHITRAEPAAPAPRSPQRYLQREARGVSMSATYIANGRDAVLLGFNEQIVRPLGALPWVYHGVLGPVPVTEAVRSEVGAALRALTPTFALRGLGSLDFLLDGDRVLILELNPRPPASLALYRRVGSGGVLGAHLRACQHGELPALARSVSAPVHGHQIVFAPRALRLDAATLACWAAGVYLHDQPRAATRFACGEPVCSVSASGADADSVKTELARRSDAVLRTLETLG